MLWASLSHVNITLDCIPIGQKFTCFSMPMAKILLTGFEPFGDNSTNISQQILNIFDTTIEISDPWYAARDNMSSKENISLVVEKQLLTVDEVGSKIVANQIVNGAHWDAIIHMGLCESCEFVRFETRAQNFIDMRIPDNKGRMVKNQKLGGTDFCCPNKVISSVKYPRIESLVISSDAGTYLCNETYYRTFEALDYAGKLANVPICFLHLPGDEKLSPKQSIEIVKQVISRLFFKPVIDVVCAVWCDGDKVMLARRGQGCQMPGCWEFPGGKIEFGETLSEAICREMKEEFGIDVTPIGFLSQHYHEYGDFSINLNLVEVQANIEELYERRDQWTSHDEILWFSDLEGINLAEADKKMAVEIFDLFNTK